MPKLSRAKMTFIGGCLLLLILAAAFIPGLLNASTVKKTEAAGIQWNISSNVGNYNSLIAAIRNAATTTYYASSTRVLTNADTILPVTLVNTLAGTQNNMIRIYIQMRNMYIVGWDTGDGTAFYYPNDQSPPVPAGGVGHILPFSSTYNDLERKGGFSRIGQIMGYQNFANAVSALAAYNGGDVTDAARGLTLLAQGIAEAVRNNNIFGEIAGGYANSIAAYPISGQDVDWETDWSKMSSALVQSMNTGVPPNLVVGNEDYITTRALILTLAVILASSLL